MWVKKTIGEQRKILATLFEPAMLNLSEICVFDWSDSDKLDKVIQTHFRAIPYCYLVYAIDQFGKQISSNISVNSVDNSYRNQDLSRRPYSVSLYPKRDFMLSSVYISQNTGRPCISAVQPVIYGQQFLGFIVADFDLHHLPLFPSKTLSCSPDCLTSPSPLVSQQRRVSSSFDQYLNEIQGILNKLIGKHGVFHCALHYASAQAMLWQIHDPYQYSLYDIEKLLDPDMYLTYPRCPYPANAKVSLRIVEQVQERFCTLRLADDRFYLRSGSLNIMNGLVSISFSFDGSQYMPAETFLSKDLCYWIGQAATEANKQISEINGKQKLSLGDNLQKGNWKLQVGNGKWEGSEKTCRFKKNLNSCF